MKYTITSVLLIYSCFFSTSCLAEFMVQQRDQQVMTDIQDANQHLLEKDRYQKYCKMQLSPYLFYRATHHLFWKDFRQSPLLSKFGDKQTKIWIGGDQHAENFGAYSNNQDQIIYGMNDFDESIIADYQYDLWRLAISLVLIADQQAIGNPKEAIESMSKAYLTQLQQLIVSNNESTLVMDANNTPKPLNKFLKKVAKKKSRSGLLNDWSYLVQGKRQFKPEHENLMPIAPHIADQLHAQWSHYIATTHLAKTPYFFTIKDIAQRIHAGTGSLGVARYYVLIEGDTLAVEDDRILDVKQQPSIKGYANSAQRHAQAYRALTNYTDDYLGWLNINNQNYSVRERSPYKKTFKAHKITRHKTLKKMARQWGILLATSHARADDDMNHLQEPRSFKKHIISLTKNKTEAFIRHITSIALAYAQQVNNDYQSMKKVYSMDCSIP